MSLSFFSSPSTICEINATPVPGLKNLSRGAGTEEPRGLRGSKKKDARTTMGRPARIGDEGPV